ncbi:hypothetical protein HK405_013155, partial [Cladochytrium tenue]
ASVCIAALATASATASATTSATASATQTSSTSSSNSAAPTSTVVAVWAAAMTIIALLATFVGFCAAARWRRQRQLRTSSHADAAAVAVDDAPPPPSASSPPSSEPTGASETPGSAGEDGSDGGGGSPDTPAEITGAVGPEVEIDVAEPAQDHLRRVPSSVLRSVPKRGADGGVEAGAEEPPPHYEP